MSFGKLSSKGPRWPFGYQMKWPMPSEAKCSRTFHEVSTEIVPPHSFCQIRLPIRWASAEEISIAACSEAVASIMMVKGTATWRLDASTFLSSVPDFILRRFWRFHFMKNLVISITLATLAAPAFAQNPPALKDNKDKISYSRSEERRVGKENRYR